MKKNIFVISTIFLGIVVVALLFTIATLQSENSDLRNNQANQISEADRYYNNVVARGMYADSPVYKTLDRSNTKIQVNMDSI